MSAVSGQCISPFTIAPLLDHIATFCNLKDVVALDMTCRLSNAAIKECWMRYLIQCNLFTYVTIGTRVDLNTHKIHKISTVFQLYKRTPKIFVNPPSETKSSQMEEVTKTEIVNPFGKYPTFNEGIELSPQKTFLMKKCWEINQTILLNLFPKKNKTKEAANSVLQSQQTSQSSAFNLETFLKDRHTNNPLKTTFFQILKQDIEQKRREENLKFFGYHESNSSNKKLSLENFFIDTLNMQVTALIHNNTELFTLLQNYRSADSEIEEKLFALEHYHLLKIIKEERDLNKIQNFITAFKIDQIKINMRFTHSLLEHHDFCEFFSRHVFLGMKISERTALEVAPSNTIRVLVAAKADINAPKLMERVLYSQNIEVIHTILESKANVNQITKSGETFLTQLLRINALKAKKEKTQSIISLLLQAKADINGCNSKGETPLICAAHHSKTNIFQFLFRQNPDPFLTDHLGKTALMHAAASSSDKCLQKINSLLARIKLITNLRKKKSPNLKLPPEFELDYADHSGATALMLATMAQQPSYVKALLEANADVTCFNNNGETALTLAKKSQRPISEIISMLQQPHAHMIKKRKRKLPQESKSS